MMDAAILSARCLTAIYLSVRHDGFMSTLPSTNTCSGETAHFLQCEVYDQRHGRRLDRLMFHIGLHGTVYVNVRPS